MHQVQVDNSIGTILRTIRIGAILRVWKEKAVARDIKPTDWTCMALRCFMITLSVWGHAQRGTHRECTDVCARAHWMLPWRQPVMVHREQTEGHKKRLCRLYWGRTCEILSAHWPSLWRQPLKAHRKLKFDSGLNTHTPHRGEYHHEIYLRSIS